MKTLLVIVAVVFLTGCGTSPRHTADQPVKKPVGEQQPEKNAGDATAAPATGEAALLAELTLASVPDTDPQTGTCVRDAAPGVAKAPEASQVIKLDPAQAHTVTLGFETGCARFAGLASGSRWDVVLAVRHEDCNGKGDAKSNAEKVVDPRTLEDGAELVHEVPAGVACVRVTISLRAKDVAHASDDYWVNLSGVAASAAP